jgi:serine/threonine protein kinase/tetratricopeptide (TPR) repeat protein
LKCLLEGALLENEATASSGTTFTDILAEVELSQAKWRIGNYEILDEIGRGGMGVIYRAREAHSHRIVALKRVLSYHTDSHQTLARFHREAETATRLDHPNIVPIYYIGEDEEGLPFFTMKLAAGGSLAQAREAFRNPRKGVSLMTKVAFAVQYAHEQGVLHRDLKPSNILLSNRWEPMVSDFGLAKWIQDSNDLTRTLTVFGTPGYIAPEQAARPGMRLTPAADIYNLGAILFELLTGRSPFVGEHALAVLRQVVEKPVPKLRSLAPHLDRDLETICARCLEREPSARYHSAGAAARDLQNWLEGRPIVARPVAIPVRLWRWSCRNRLLASMLAAFLVLATASVPWRIRSWKLQNAAHETALATRSVAVIPFFDLDNVAADESLARSVAESLKHELDRIAPTRMKPLGLAESASWTTIEQIRKIGQAAKARAVLTGTTRTIGHERKRISFRLLDAATAEPLVVRVCESNGLEELKKTVGKDIGGTIDGILNAKDWSSLSQSTTDRGLRNPATREAIMAGHELVFRYNLPDLDTAIDLFKKALRLEPDSSLAHAYLAMAASVRTHFISDDSFLKLAAAEAYKALQLSPNSSDAHEALAGVFYQQGKFLEALEEGLRTAESNGPEEKIAGFIGMTLDTLGHPDRALAWHSLSCKLGGRWSDEYGLLGDSWAKLCDDERALQAYRRAAQLQPEPPVGEIGICHLRLLQGDLEGARELWRSRLRSHGGFGEAEQIAAQIEFFARRFDTAASLYAALTKTDADGGGSFYGCVTYRSALGRARQALGNEEGAKAILKDCLFKETAAVDREPENPEASYRLAAVEASLGMSERSIAHLKRAVSSGWIDYRSLAMDPRFDAIREDPQVETIIKDLMSKVADMRVKTHKY